MVSVSMIQSINPYNAEVLFQRSPLTISETASIIKQCRTASDSWQHQSIRERSAVIKRIGELLRQEKSMLSQLISREMGKLIHESIAEIEKCAHLCDYYAENSESLLQDDLLQTRFSKAVIRYQPLGVVMGIMPWNFPFWQVIRFAVPVLISGNTIVLKHASNVSLCSLALEELFSRAYPDGAIFKSLLIRGKDTEQVLREGYVNGVSVTGSEQTGRSVGEAAGASIIKQVYELGGNDAFIVFEDVDLEYVAKAAVKSRLINCGQSCISAKRFMIQNSVYDEFLDIYKSELKQFTFGNPLHTESNLAPLATSAFADALTSIIKQASAHGAETLNPFHREGAFIAPNLLLNVDERNPVYDEELFGPIGMVHRFNRSDDAINLANHSRFGLSASVWTMDIKRADYVANAIKSGSVFINMYPQSDAAVPFGGIKCSGYGREMGRDGLLEFTNKKAIIIP